MIEPEAVAAATNCCVSNALSAFNSCSMRAKALIISGVSQVALNLKL
jgi:hypothetical protein